MRNSSPTHVIGLLGTSLDRGTEAHRWQRWRPTVALCQQEDLVVDRFDLLHPPQHQVLADVVAADIAKISPETELHLHPLELRDPWDFAEVYGALYDWAKAHQVVESERTLLHITTGTHVQQICLFLLNEAHYLPGKLLQTSPALGKSQDPAGTYSTIDLDLSKYDQLSSRFAREHVDSQTFLKSGIATRNAAFNRLIDEIETVALRSKHPMLLTGPTGAGKSQLARRLYELRKQHTQLEGRFVEVNCATLRGDTAMSTLFGHVKGSFTGAQRDRPGLLREAHGGLLFLDEIGELGLDEQAMLLRALEEKVFLPLGSDHTVTSDFQLLAGSNRDLPQQVRDGRFRADLLARINLWSFCMPSLADRREDIEPNIDYELERFAEREARQVRFNREAREHFLKFAESPDASWAANFRDLNASITRMATLCDRGRITKADVTREIDRLRTAWHDGSTEAPWLTEFLSEHAMAELDPFDRVQLAHVVKVCCQAKTLSAAGRELFAVSRLGRRQPNDADRLRKYLARFGLTWKSIQEVNSTNTV